MRDLVKVYFCLLKIQVKFWINLKLETRLSTYDFSTLYTTLPYNLIKDKFIDLIERTFKREGSPYLSCNERNAFFTSEKNLKNIMPKNNMHDLVKMYVMS